MECLLALLPCAVRPNDSAFNHINHRITQICINMSNADNPYTVHRSVYKTGQKDIDFFKLMNFKGNSCFNTRRNVTLSRSREKKMAQV